MEENDQYCFTTEKKAVKIFRRESFAKYPNMHIVLIKNYYVI